jgi:hypothetical protein
MLAAAAQRVCAGRGTVIDPETFQLIASLMHSKTGPSKTNYTYIQEKKVCCSTRGPRPNLAQLGCVSLCRPAQRVNRLNTSSSSPPSNQSTNKRQPHLHLFAGPPLALGQRACRGRQPLPHCNCNYTASLQLRHTSAVTLLE